MRDITTPLPCRRPELVAYPFARNGSFLVRDRQAGESFTLGPEEYFLLAQLDGTRNAPVLCEAFAERFGDPLTEQELDDFLHLARQRGLLQEEDDREARPRGTRSRPVRPWDMATAERGRRTSAPRTRPMRLISLFLGAVASVVQCLAVLLERAVGWIRSVKLIHCEFVPRPDDIFIVTYPRSGTTWMQMILYQLTTDGSMDFPHIYEYCPWFEESSRSADGFEGRPSPRLFKSHLSYGRIPKGPGKYIYIARNGKDVAVSFFHFSRSHGGFRGTFDEFFERFMRGRVEGGSWFKHVKGWWRHRNDANVLFLYYEELLHDLEGCLRRIIAFCNLDVDPARLPTILERSSFAFMKAHESQFDPQRGVLWEQGVQSTAFIRQGQAGAWKGTLSPQQAARFDKDFRSELGRTGIDFAEPR
jgi:hypothetical protein